MKIILIGGYGYTGKIICELLEKESVQYTVAGRDAEKLKQLQLDFHSIESTFALDIRDHEQVKRLVEEFDVILNCAGPFTEESASMVGLIANSKSKIYFDITGEIGFARSSFEQNNSIAIENKTTLIHGCAFESLVADLALKMSEKKLDRIKEIKTFYSFQHSKPSPGTRITMKLSKFRNMYRIANSVWKVIKSEEEKIPVSFEGVHFTAVAYPLPEIAFSFWNYKPESVMSYLLLSKEEALFVGTPEQLTGTLEDELEKLKKRKTNGPVLEDRQAQQCRIIVQISDHSGKTEVLSLFGNDMYLITAKCVVFSMKSFLEKGEQKFGVISPAQLFEGIEMKTLNKLGISIRD